MADAAARRREARKRKLLMTSEDRLNRILQLNVQAKEELEAQSEETYTPQEEVPETSTSDQEIPSQNSHDAEVESTQADGVNRGQEQDANKSEDGDTPLLSPSDPHELLADKTEDAEVAQESSSSNIESTEQNHLTENITKSPSPALTRRTQAGSTTETQDSTGDSPTLTQNTATSKTETKTVVKKQQLLSAREMVCVLSAVAMRGMLTCDGFVQRAGQSIIIPFLILQLTLQAVTSKQQTPEESGGMLFRVLSMALMLSKVPPQTVSRLKYVMSVFTKVFADFTMYLFAFITCHCILEVFS